MTGPFWLVVGAWFIMAFAWIDMLRKARAWRKTAYTLKDIVEEKTNLRVNLMKGE